MTQSLLNVKTDETLILICEENPQFRPEPLSYAFYFLSISEIQFDFFIQRSVCVCVITEHLFQGTGKPIYFLFE
jgi:hypothetical protein